MFYFRFAEQYQHRLLPFSLYRVTRPFNVYLHIIRIQRTSSTFSRRKCKWLSGAQDQQTEQKARDSPLLYDVYITLLITMCIKSVVSLGFILIRSRTVFLSFVFPLLKKNTTYTMYNVAPIITCKWLTISLRKLLRNSSRTYEDFSIH